ncbi:MAG: type II secretion system F family protein [Gammaproteobacteria bacterium]|nr:type II secretion system F family protein [Gammaproteobacteria bacterium]
MLPYHQHNRKFYWQGIDHLGNRRRGFEYAINQEQLTHLLKQQHIVPIEIKADFWSYSKTKITKKTIHDFTRQLANLLNAAIPLANALKLLMQTSPPNFRALLHRLHHLINSGLTFSKALANYPRYFDEVYCQLVAAGERTGTLNNILSQLADYAERIDKLQRKIRGALYYPLSILIVAIIVTYAMLVFVVPQFEEVFTSFGADLPAFTQCVVALARYLKQYSFSLLITVSLTIIGLRMIYLKQPKLKYSWQKLLLNLPGIKLILIHAELSRWARVLATLHNANIQLPQALTAAAKVIRNGPLRKNFLRLSQDIQLGLSLQQALSSQDYLPERLQQLLAAGEKSSQLAITFTHIANQLQQQLDTELNHLSKLLEPAIMVVLAIITGGLIIAMYLPVFNIGTAI